MFWLTILLPLLSSLLSFSAVRGKPHRLSADAACQQLLTSLGSDVVSLPSTAAYQQGQDGAWNNFNRQQHPSCIIYARNSSDVSTAIISIGRNDLNYQVRSGGHSAMAGWNNVDGGILISLQNLNTTRYDPASTYATVGAGVRWRDVYNQLAPFNVTVVGGRQGDVGTGFLLGGGLSFLSPRAGYGADNIVEAEVVLTSGAVVTASATQNVDLLRALRGSVNRMGIVTRYTLRTVEVGATTEKRFFGGAITPLTAALGVNGSDPLVTLLAAFEKFTANLNDPKAYALAVIGQQNTLAPVKFASILVLYEGSELPRSVFGPLLDVPGVIVTAQPMSWLDATHLYPDGTSDGSGWHYGAAALYPRGDGGDNFRTMYAAWNLYNQQTFSYQQTSYLAFTPIPKTHIQALYQAPGGPGVIRPPLKNFAAVQISGNFNAATSTTPPAFLQQFQELTSK
ncbi:hypothetical protein OC845_006815 [Tilletia horrida]|nr:hypothetical protein OC845_006815 [Tilletia horrida]